jgi:adenosylmethionine---8-amino-7-oxononanoate aminotransferase
MKNYFLRRLSVADGKALAYGHSYTGNALACAAAKASLEVFEKEGRLGSSATQNPFSELRTWRFEGASWCKGVRRFGFIAGIETAQPQMAAAVCIEARRHGLLTRPIGNVVVLMPPLCITMAQLIKALRTAIIEVWGRSNASHKRDAEEVTA